MYICMYICIYVYIYICIYTHRISSNIYIYIYTHTYIFDMYICTYTYARRTSGASASAKPRTQTRDAIDIVCKLLIRLSLCLC